MTALLLLAVLAAKPGFYDPETSVYISDPPGAPLGFLSESELCAAYPRPQSAPDCHALFAKLRQQQAPAREFASKWSPEALNRGMGHAWRILVWAHERGTPAQVVEAQEEFRKQAGVEQGMVDAPKLEALAAERTRNVCRLKAEERAQDLSAVRKSPGVVKTFVTIQACFYRSLNAEARAEIAAERKNARIAGVVSLRTLYENQEVVANSNAALASVLREAKAAGVTPGRCSDVGQHLACIGNDGMPDPRSGECMPTVDLWAAVTGFDLRHDQQCMGLSPEVFGK